VAVGIFNLHERPQHAAAVARRIWKAFWQHKGTPLALVVEIDGQPCGNARWCSTTTSRPGPT
jgi:hypothetical protein